MAFETFPIPESNPKAEAVQQRISEQKDKLVNVAAKLYANADARLTAQDKASRAVNGKLARAVNGRIKAQGAATQPIVDSLYNAVVSGIAQQGQQLAVQSAVIPRLFLASPEAPSAPLTAGVGSASVPFVTATTARLPGIPPIPNPPPGTTAPPFPLAPQEVLPQPVVRPVIPSPTSGPGYAYAAVVDCDKKSVDVYDLSAPDNPWLNGVGSFVPIRYGSSREDLLRNWLGQSYEANRPFVPEWIRVACHALATNGEGWPARGEFPYAYSTTLAMGLGVGDWPFDSDGNYIGP